MKGLNLGCGFDIRAGWVNVDQAYPADQHRADGTVLLRHDLRTPLPFEPDAFDIVYTSHFLEHLDTLDAVELLKRTLSVMKPGALTRHCIPDARLIISAYVEKREDYMRTIDRLTQEHLPPPQMRTPIDYITGAAHGWGHKCLYDPAKGIAVLKAAGFVDVREDAFDPSVDIENRREVSFYVVGRAPG